MNYLIKKYKENDKLRLVIQILGLLIISRVLMLITMLIYNASTGNSHSIAFLMNQWDAKRYYYIIENGYTFPLDTDPQANWAFFPMYVLVCKAVKAITFNKIDTYWIGMLVSNVCTFISAYYAVRCARMFKDRGINPHGKAYMAAGVKEHKEKHEKIYDKTLLIAVLMMFAPYTFYFASTYTEAMFVMFIVLFFYFSMQKKYFLAGLMAAFASGTRIVGCTLIFPLIIQMYMDMVPGRVSLKGIKTFISLMLKKPANIVSVMICPFGTFAYMTFLNFFCGDAWAFLHVQIAWREDYYFPVLGVLWKACTGQIEFRYTYMGWFCIAAFVLYGYMIYRKYYAMALFGIISLLVPLCSHVMSTCRFTVGTFVVFVGVYDLLSRSNAIIRRLCLLLFAVIEVCLLFLWYNSDCWLM